MDEELPSYKDATIKYLCNLSEKKLQTEYIEPLLRLTGYTHVYEMGGAGDRGKDLVAVREEFGRHKLYAIQVKRFKLSGKYAHPTSMTYVLNQLEQIFNEETLDPVTRVQRVPDRCIFITPYQISRAAFESGISRLQKAERKDLTLIDGPILLDHIIKYMPSSVASIHRETPYRLAVKQNTKYVPESMAFEVKDLVIERIYVDLALLHGSESIEAIASLRTNAVTTKVLTDSVQGVSKFVKSCHDSFNASVEIDASSLPASNTYRDQFNQAEAKLLKKKEGLVKEIRLAKEKLATAANYPDEKQRNIEQRLWGNKIKDFTEDQKCLSSTTVKIITMSPVFNIIKKQCRSYINTLDGQLINTLDSKAFTRVIKSGLDLGQRIAVLKENDFFKVHWDHISERNGTELDQIPACLRAELLPKLEMPILISGAPGAGKTTLLRRFTSDLADKASGVLPILVTCNEIKDPSLGGLYSHALIILKDQGIHLSETRLKQQFDKGKYRLLFDGLDEAGEKAGSLLMSIGELSNIHERTFPIVTARESLHLEAWKSALNLHLAPFNDLRLKQFIDQWFTSEPSQKARLNSWLTENPAMKRTVRTPLIAAVACALVGAHAEMPTTELELYERRFELLLGKWDKAKGLPGLGYEEFQRHLHFIMEMAFRAHVKETRVFPVQIANEVAMKFRDPNRETDGAALVNDCLRRGVCLQESHSVLTFGHLTYQEFLVARYLAHHNPTEFICKVIGKMWWQHALQVYATRMLDISRLLVDALKSRVDNSRLDVLRGLLQFAPLTDVKIATFYKERGYDTAGLINADAFEMAKEMPRHAKTSRS